MNPAVDSSARSTFPRHPTVPTLLAWPLAVIPRRVHSTVLAKLLNMQFAAQIRNGDFEFLHHRRLLIQVRDAQVAYQIRYDSSIGFAPHHSMGESDLTISGTLYDFLALATRREDSDTLFFNRRVVMAGDTALGLELKNLLDGIDFAALAQPTPLLLKTADRLLGTYERFKGR
jgi:predicted lipid carrier protein YhbT